MCITKRGCCGSSLQKTCMVIGIILTVWTSLDLITTLYFCVQVTNLIYIGFSIAECVCLILAAKYEYKDLILPFLIGYALNFLHLILAMIKMYSALTRPPPRSYEHFEHYEDDPNDDNGLNRPDNFFMQAMKSDVMCYVTEVIDCTLWVVITSALLLYPISYYLELKSRSTQRTSSRDQPRSSNNASNKRPTAGRR